MSKILGPPRKWIGSLNRIVDTPYQTGIRSGRVEASAKTNTLGNESIHERRTRMKGKLLLVDRCSCTYRIGRQRCRAMGQLRHCTSIIWDGNKNYKIHGIRIEKKICGSYTLKRSLSRSLRHGSFSGLSGVHSGCGAIWQRSSSPVGGSLSSFLTSQPRPAWLFIVSSPSSELQLPQRPSVLFR